MYSGIIQHFGKVTDIREEREGGRRLRVEADPSLLERVSIGSSVNVDGVCLTVVSKEGNVFAVDVMPQSLSLTTIGRWTIGTQVNLEPSLRLGDEVGGHFLYGHVDGIASLLERKPDGNAERLSFALPAHLRSLVVPQGSVALNGVSLTVVSCDPLTVSLIPETRTRTTLGTLAPGDVVNVEADMLMKYVAETLTPRSSS